MSPEIDQVRFGVTQSGGRGVGRLDQVLAQKELNLPRLVLYVRKGERSLFAPGHEPARDRDRLAIERGKFIQDLLGVVGSFALGRVRVES